MSPERSMTMRQRERLRLDRLRTFAECYLAVAVLLFLSAGVALNAGRAFYIWGASALGGFLLLEFWPRRKSPDR